MNDDVAKIIKEAGQRVREIWKHKENPEELSRLGVELTALSWAIGEWYADFDNQEREAKTEIDLEHADLVEKYINQDMPVSRAEVKAKVDLGSKRREYNKIMTGVTKTKIARHDIEKCVDMVRTRISLIKEDLRKA